MTSTWLYLIRHGEVEHAAEGRFFGHSDVGLSPVGQAQVAALGRRLAREPIAAVYSSDLRRARDSAAPLAAARGVAPVAVGALREAAMGRWEGLTYQQIRAREPGLLARWLADPVTVPFPDGESLADLHARIVPALEAVLARHPGQRVAVVAHGGANRVVLAEALGLPLANALRLSQDYAALSLVEYRRDRTVVHVVNERLPEVAGIPPVEAMNDVGGPDAGPPAPVAGPP
jgi:alpha-ribazole phosphatase